MERALYRSRHDRMIAGVAGGIAEYFDVDPTLVRIGIVLLALVGNAAVVLVYLVMAILVPEEPLERSTEKTEAPMPAPMRSAVEPPPDGRSRRGGAVTGVVLVVVGVLLLAQQFLRIDVGQLWPLILITIGVWIMFGRGR